MFRVIIFAAANLGILLVMGVVFQLIGLDIWLVQSGTGFNTAGCWLLRPASVSAAPLSHSPCRSLWRNAVWAFK